MKQLKKIVLSLFLLASSLALFTGCTAKEPPVVFKPQVICYEFVIHQISPKVELELYLEDEELEVLNTRADELHRTIKFYETQIYKYENFCKKYRVFGNTEQPLLKEI